MSRAVEALRGQWSRFSTRLPDDISALTFVALVWCVQSYVLLDLVATVSVNCPMHDEWEMVPALTGAQPITPSWLWSQHNEHRIVLPRLIYLLVNGIAGDFLGMPFVDACILILMAASCCVAARRLRGHSTFADAFFPLLLLHGGQGQNLDWGFQIQFVSSAALSVTALLLLIPEGPLSYRAALGLGGCTLALGLTGGQGIALVPAMACCTALAALDRRRERPDRRREWLVPLALAASAVVTLAFYFVDYERPARHPISPSIAATWTGTLQTLTTGFGSAVKRFWPLGSGHVALALTLATAALILGCIVWSQSRRMRALRLGLFLAGLSCMLLGIAWARVALYRDHMFESRYATLMAPFFCGVYFVWELAKRPGAARFVQTTLLVITAMLVVDNREHGLREGQHWVKRRGALITQVVEGVPVAELTKRHCRVLYHFCWNGTFPERLRMLRDKGIGDFVHLKD